MGRISRQQLFMGIARLAAMRATCFRLNVGAVIVEDNNPLAVGYNGQPRGAPHCTGNDCVGRVPGRCNTLHAEANAIRKAEERLADPLRVPGSVDLYCTHSPCRQCAGLISESPLNIGRIFFEVAYRDTSHLSMFKQTREVYVVTAAGYVVDYFTNRVVELP